MSVPLSADSRELELLAWKIAPRTATPKVPPTIRDIESNPDARPDFATSTAFIAAVDIGDIVSADPEAHEDERDQQRRVAGGVGDLRLHVERDGDDREARRRSAAAAPIRSVIRPAIGATTMITSVVGRNLTPASSGE